MLKYQVNYKKSGIGYLRHKEFHRIEGPAYINKSGAMTWDQYGKSHRLDGPSIIYSDGLFDYFIRGKNQC